MNSKFSFVIALSSLLIATGCGRATSGVDFKIGAPEDPVLVASRNALTAIDSCSGGATQGPRRILFDDFSSATPNDPLWPMAAGYDADFNADWQTDGLTARPRNPNWVGSDPFAPVLPVTTGFVKFMNVCPLPQTALTISADVITSALTDDMSDATLVLYIFDGSGNVLDIQASYALRRGNSLRLTLADVPLAMAARRIAVVPMVRLGPNEQQSAFYDNLAVDVENTASTSVYTFVDDFSKFENNSFGNMQPLGWSEYGGDFFIYPNYNWATLWNGSWGGAANSAPPFEAGLYRSIALSGIVKPGDLVSAKVLSANTFKDPNSFSMMRLSFDTSATMYDSSKLAGTAWASLSVRKARIPDGSLSMNLQLIANLGAAESSSLYFDDLSLKIERPAVILRAAKIYSPSSTWFDGIADFRSDAMVDVLSEVLIDTDTLTGAASPWSLSAGNAGNHGLEVHYDASGGTSVVCTYKGGASQAHPSGTSQLSLARRYVFVSCNNGSVAGSQIRASVLTLHILNGDSAQGSTRVKSSFNYAPM